METSMKMLLNKTVVAGLVNKVLKIGLTPDVPTYNTVHFYHITSLRELHYCHALSVANVISYEIFDIHWAMLSTQVFDSDQSEVG